MEGVSSPSSRKLLWALGLTAALLGALALRGRRTPEGPPPSAPPPPPPNGDEVETFRSDPAVVERLSRNPAPVVKGDADSRDWPQWRGPRRDGVSRDAAVLEAWGPSGPRRLWTAAGGEGHSSVSIAGGLACVQVQEKEDEVVLGLDAVTGLERWRHRDAARFSESFAGVGPHATPLLEQGRVYAVGSTGHFFCIDAMTGKTLWCHDFPREFETELPDYGFSGSPLVDGDRVVVLPGSVKKGSVAAFDRTTGRLLWTSLRDRPGYSSPVIATIGGRRQIVVVTGEAVAGLAPEDGSVLWRSPWSTYRECNIATPIVVGSAIFVSSGYGKGCALLEATPDPAGAFSVRPAYEHNRMRNHFSSCVLLDGHLYGFDEAFLVCMEWKSGKVLWKERKVGKGSLIGVAGRLVLLNETGTLFLVEASPEGYRELASFKVSSTRCWAPPSLAGGKLYLRDQATISCFDLGTAR